MNMAMLPQRPVGIPVRSRLGTPNAIAAEILAKLQTTPAAIHELQEMLED